MDKGTTRVLIYAHLASVFLFPIAIIVLQIGLLFYVYLGIAFVIPLVFLISAIKDPQRFRFFAFLCDLFISLFQLLFGVLPMIS